MLIVASVELTALSMTQTLAVGFSLTKANPLVINPAKKLMAKVTKNAVKPMPAKSPRYLVLSCISISTAILNTIYPYLFAQIHLTFRLHKEESLDAF